MFMRIKRLKGRTGEELRHAAIHEAGHAVAARMLSLACGAVSIVPAEKKMIGGYHVTEPPHVIREAWFKAGKYRGARDTLSMLQGQIMTCMAGREAEIIAFGERNIGGDRVDMFEIDRLANFANFAGGANTIFSHAYLTRLRSKVGPLLRHHWHKVVAVAQALLVKKTLTGPEIDAIITNVTTPRERTIAKRIEAARKPMRASMPPVTSIASSKAQGPPIYQSSRRPNSS
jgi:ATP-dependent Zn protease